MSQRKPVVIDGEVQNVAMQSSIDDVVPKDVNSVLTSDGELITRSQFMQVPVPEGFKTNLSQINKMLVQPAGQHSMVAGLDAIEANLRVGNDSANILIHPKIVIPKITQLRLPRKGFVGKPIKFKWKTLDTEQCKLMISNGDGVKEAEVDACGETELHPTHVGVMRVTVTAFSKHADLSEESIVSSEMTMNIKEPPVTIEIPKRFQSAPIGESVCFNWNVLGANQVNLEAIDRNQVWSVPACGALQVAIDIEVERFRLVASNEHSQEKQVEFSTTPEILTSLSDPIDLPNLES